MNNKHTHREILVNIIKISGQGVFELNPELSPCKSLLGYKYTIH